MFNSVMQELEDYSEGGFYKNGSLRNAESDIKHSTPSPYSLSPSKSYKVSGEEMNSIAEYVSVLSVFNTVLLLF